MNSNIELITQGDFVVKIRKPDRIGIAPVLLFLHGWTGDENSMWIFAEKIPKTFLLIAPRAPFMISNPNFQGNTWVEKPSGPWSWLEDFNPAILKLKELLKELSRQYEGDFNSINIAGFSQGAAMAFAYALQDPEKVKKIAGLAGFLPTKTENVLAQKPLEGKPIFIAHGSKDQIVKIETAYTTRDLLQKSGANVTFCESEVGHRLDKNCYSAFADFISA